MRLSKSDIEILQMVKAVLEKEYKYHHTHAQLAVRFHISENKLRKGFVVAFNIPINEFLICIRIEQAKVLLMETDEQVKAIAYKVGYNVKSLEKQFKKLTGMPPLQWRRNLPAVQMGVVR